MNPDDEQIVAAQLGRPPRGTWRVVARCQHGAPEVIAISPRLGDGTPFPTTFWLTCPALVSELHARESAGEHAAWTDRARHDESLAHEMRAAAEAYRAARAAEASDEDTCEGGVAGERDPLRVKCLHARVAAHLAGLPDPIGRRYVEDCARVTGACDGRRCAQPPLGDV